MILLGKKELDSKKALKERKEYVLSLIDEGFKQASPSSQEYTSPEFQAGHTAMLREEIAEIDARLKLIKRRNR